MPSNQRSGTAVPVDRDYNRDGQVTLDEMERYLTERLAQDPNAAMPNGYTADEGAVTRDQPGVMFRNPWLWPAIGIGGGALGGALTGGGAAAGLSEASIPTSVGVPSGSIPAGTTMGTGGIGSFLSQNKNWLAPIIGAGAGLLGRQLMPQQNTQMPMPPELQQLLTEATRRTMNQGPLSDAITKQALAGLPNYARGQ